MEWINERRSNISKIKNCNLRFLSLLHICFHIVNFLKFLYSYSFGGSPVECSLAMRAAGEKLKMLAGIRRAVAPTNARLERYSQNLPVCLNYKKSKITEVLDTGFKRLKRFLKKWRLRSCSQRNCKIDGRIYLISWGAKKRKKGSRMMAADEDSFLDNLVKGSKVMGELEAARNTIFKCSKGK